MADFKLHTEADHSPAAADAIAMAKKKYGFVPNLIAGLANEPAAVAAYIQLGDALRATEFSPTELHVLWFTINTYHTCDYCMAAHTGIAKMEKIADDVVETARTGGDYADPKLQALKTFALRMVDSRGYPTEAELNAFFAAGYDQRAVIGVILAIAHKTLSNYTNHVVKTPVDDNFKPFAWSPSSVAAE